MEKRAHILVVDDEQAIADLVVNLLVAEGMDALACYSGQAALDMLARTPFDLAIVDIMMPGIDGFELCVRMRQMRDIPVIFLSAKDEEADQVVGFTLGAEDYVTKPFSPAELTARIDALYRRIGGDVSDDGVISQPPFVLNTRRRSLEKHGQRIKLTQVEYSIMRMFMENPGKALSREEILDLVWGRDYFGELKIVDVNIRRLRMKVEDEPSHPTHIMTVWGYGYRWNV